jgi:hypothetical protein
MKNRLFTALLLLAAACTGSPDSSQTQLDAGKEKGSCCCADQAPKADGKSECCADKATDGKSECCAEKPAAATTNGK